MSNLLIVCCQDELLRAAFCYEVSATDQGPGIRLTVHGKQRSVTIKEMSMMSLDVFAAIWSVRDCSIALLCIRHRPCFALRRNKVQCVYKLAMIEDANSAGVALVGTVESQV